MLLKSKTAKREMKILYDVVFVGAGAGSLMAASFLSGKRVALVDSSGKIAPKIKISGGGRCNFTNQRVSSENYLGDSEFVKQTLKSFGQKDLLDFFDGHRLNYELRDDGKFFCKSTSAEIIGIFSKLTKYCDFFLGQTVQNVDFKDGFIIETDKQTLKAKKLVVASGGLSFKTLGASDIGYKIAQKFGHKVATLTPALVGFTLQKEQFWMKELSGISCMVTIDVNSKTIEEELLFAHKGISGPAVLSASLYWKKGAISINFLPYDDLDDILRSTKKLISSAIPLSKRFMRLFLEHIGIEDKPCNRLSEREKEQLRQLQNYSFSPAGNFGFSKAEVSRGGVSTENLNANTLCSKKHEGLYFIGEVVDVTGELGGYNFQWAFSSAVVCAKDIANLNQTRA